MPYWLWADAWEGVIRYKKWIDDTQKRGDTIHFERTTVSISSAVDFDQRIKEDNSQVFWLISSHPTGRGRYFWLQKIKTIITDRELPLARDGDFTEQQRLEGRWNQIHLSQHSELLIDPQRDTQVIMIGTPEPIDVDGVYTYLRFGDWICLFDKYDCELVNEEKSINIADRVILLEPNPVELPLPDPFDKIKGELDRLGGPYRDIINTSLRRSDNENYDIIAWELWPVHNHADWRLKYQAILVSERETWVQHLEGILAEAERKGSRSIVARGIRRILERHDRWIEQLLDDADRVMALLVQGEVPDFLTQMYQRDSRVAARVMEGPAETIALIHRHLWSFVPVYPAGSMRVFHDRLPPYLQDLYPTPRHLRQVLTMK